MAAGRAGDRARRRESFRIRRFDGPQLGEKTPLILTGEDSVEPLCRSLALSDLADYIGGKPITLVAGASGGRHSTRLPTPVRQRNPAGHAKLTVPA